MKLDKIKFKCALSASKNVIGRLPNQGTIVLSGKTNSGKSTQARDILKDKRDMFASCYAISETEHLNKTFGNHMPKNLIDKNFSESKMEKVVNFQAKLWLKSKGTARMVILMDDCMSDKKFLSTPILRRLFQQSRHYGILFIICTQYYMDIPKGLRSQVEYVSFGSENNVEIRRTMYKHLFGFFPNFREFDAVYKKYTSDFNVIFIKGNGKSYEIKENMFFYKSKSYDKQGEYKHEFVIGGPSIWAKCREKRKGTEYT